MYTVYVYNYFLYKYVFFFQSAAFLNRVFALAITPLLRRRTQMEAEERFFTAEADKQSLAVYV